METTKYRSTDRLYRTEKDLKFLQQFREIFMAAFQGDLMKCKEVVDDKFYDFEATSCRIFKVNGKALDKISPKQIARMRGNTDIVKFFDEMTKNIHNQCEKTPEKIPYKEWLEMSKRSIEKVFNKEN